MNGLGNPSAFYCGYIVERKLVGMVSAGEVDRDTLKIFQLYVLPDYQRKGIGRKLMDAATAHFADVRRVVLEVEEGNHKGISFYKKYGFDYPNKTMVRVDGDEIPCLVGELQLRRA